MSRAILTILALVLVAYALRRRDVTARPDWYIDGGSFTTLNETWTVNR